MPIDSVIHRSQRLHNLADVRCVCRWRVGMHTRDGKYIDYPGGTEVVPGVYLSQYGDVYIHDQYGEVCCWVYHRV